MSEAEAVRPQQEHLVCKVTRRSQRKEQDGAKMLRGLERLGVSAEILESLWKAQEDRGINQS